MIAWHRTQKAMNQRTQDRGIKEFARCVGKKTGSAKAWQWRWESIPAISVSRSTWGIEQFVQEALVHYAPQIYSYVYTDLRGNIRINKNAFEHPDEVIQFLPLILELDEGVEYAVYFGNTLTETFSFIRKQKPQEGYNITVRPVAEAEYINVTLIFKEESRHDEQKPD